MVVPIPDPVKPMQVWRRIVATQGGVFVGEHALLAGGDGMNEHWGPPTALDVFGVVAGHAGFSHHTQETIRHLLVFGVEIGVQSTYRDAVETWPAWLQPYAGPLPAATMCLQICPPTLVKWTTRLPIVNFTTFEGDRIHQAYVDVAMRSARTVVTTRQCKEAWVASGVPESRVGVVPLGVDSARFDGQAPPLDLTLPDGSPLASRRTRLLHVSSAGPRKNQEGLVRAWLEATRPDDDAVLVLRAGDSWPGATNEVRASIRRAERRTKKTLADAAPIIFLQKGLPEDEMPRLYASATHYISASCGEGWDLSTIEAAASGLTLIVPDHTAYREYLDPGIATMIPSRLELNTMPPRGPFAPYFEGVHWWRPQHDALTDAIRRAVAGEALPRGAQERVRTDYTWEATAIRLTGELAIARG